MEQSGEVLDVLECLVSADANPVTVSVSAGAKKGLNRLRKAIEDRDVDAVVSSGSNGLLSAPPEDLTDPEELKYFNLYRESYTVEHLHIPGTQRVASAARTKGGFKASVKRTINASRFIANTSRSTTVHAELNNEMEKLLDWDEFHVNRVAQLSDRQPLVLVGLTALNHFGLLHTFSIDQQNAISFLQAVEHHYMPNPYHNSTHAADVTQALLCILYQDSLYVRFTDLELLAVILAAIVHDTAHPGFNNMFLTKTQDEQALMYNDQSTNEALSLSIAFKILQAPECNLFVNMSREDYFYLRRLITDIVLGTDMAVHSSILENARLKLHTGNADRDVWASAEKADTRLLVMKTIVHVADISNASRPPWLAGMWTRAVYEEFFKQGDAEKEMGLDVSPLCDRDSVGIAESQKVFLNFVVAPTWDLVKDIAPKSHAIAMQHITQNQKLWAALAESGDPSAVLCYNDPVNPAQRVHVSPSVSPFHSQNQSSWGNADMLLLLLNDEENTVIGDGIKLICNREASQNFSSNT